MNPTKIITHLDEFETVIPEQIARFGICRTYKAPDATTIIVLPTASLTLPHLIETNWDPKKSYPRGHFRSVVEVNQLLDGTRTGIFIKSPECVFSGSRPERLWWDGPKGKDAPLKLEDPLVEDQVDWEAAILLALAEKQIRAEVPQAIITKESGEKRLIVRAIPSKIGVYGNPALHARQIRERIREIGLLDVDFVFTENAFVDEEGCTHIIDVNRWEWPGKIDEFRASLRARLALEIQRHTSTSSTSAAR